MKRSFSLLMFVLFAAVFLHAQSQWSFRGTVIKMQMGNCVVKGFVAAMSGTAAAAMPCPEYTVLSDRVVYVVVGRHAEAFIPLAEDLDFIVRKNELVLFSDDEKAQSRFVIQQMTLRSEWELVREHREMVARATMDRATVYSPRPALMAARNK
jgi:hypothetical protein